MKGHQSIIPVSLDWNLEFDSYKAQNDDALGNRFKLINDMGADRSHCNPLLLCSSSNGELDIFTLLKLKLLDEPLGQISADALLQIFSSISLKISILKQRYILGKKDRLLKRFSADDEGSEMTNLNNRYEFLMLMVYFMNQGLCADPSNISSSDDIFLSNFMSLCFEDINSFLHLSSSNEKLKYCDVETERRKASIFIN